MDTKALYQALRSNNRQEVIKTLETSLPISTIAQVYQELQLRNVPLAPQIQLLLESHLIDHQFLRNQSKATEEDPFSNLKNHLEFLCQLIGSCHKATHDMQFVYHLRHVAQHMTVLKRQLEFSFKTLPWEEMQFYICLYLYNEQKRDVIYKLLITKEGLCAYLSLFHQELRQVSKDLTENSFGAKKLNRTLQYESIIASCKTFKPLLDDFLLLRDVYSLNKIISYINKALEVDVAKHGFVAYLVIERALQVAGEYMKNTPDSPNLSEHLYKYLLRCSPRNLKNILTSLRNMLSHSFSLNRKIGIEESGFFVKIQHDLKKIKNDILYVLYVQKIKILKTFLSRVLEYESIEQVSDMGALSEVEEELSGFDASDFQTTKELVTAFCHKVLEDSDEDSDTINEILSCLSRYEHKNVTISSVYLETVNELSQVLNTQLDLKIVKRMARTYLSMLFSQAPHNLYQDVFLKIRQVADNFKKRRNYDPDDYKNQDDKSIDINTMLNEIYNYIRWRLPTIKWMEEMESTLVFKEEKSEKEVQVEEVLRLVQAQVLAEEVETAVAKSKEVHVAKSALLSHQNLTPEEFLDNLKKLGLTSKRQAELLQHHTRNKHDKIATGIKNVNDSYGTFIKNIPDMFPVSKYTQTIIEFYKSLQLKPLLAKITKAINLVIDEQVKQCYSARLNMLKLLPSQLNELEIVALEMLVLDLMELLENLKLLHDNKALMVDEPVILMGKQVRNILAHGDLLMDLLPGTLRNSLQYHGKKLLDLGLRVLELHDVVIGQKHASSDYAGNFRKSLEVISEQAKLFAAVKAGDVNGFDQAVDQGADVLGLDSFGRGIVDVASKSCMLEKIPSKFALAQDDRHELEGLTIKAKRAERCEELDRQTLIHSCIRSGQLEALKPLLENFTHEPEHLLDLAAKYGQLPNLRHLMQIFPSHVNLESLLQTASTYGHYEIIQEFASHPKNLIHLAAKHGHDELVTLFLNNLNELDDDLKTALHWASCHNHAHIGQVLLSAGCKVNLQDSQGMAPLHLAIRNGSAEMFDVLLDYNADLDLRDHKGRTVLHLAAESGSCEMIEVLIQRYNIDVNILDGNQDTPLITAAYNGHQDAVECLLKNKADPDHQGIDTNSNNSSAMTFAATQGNIEIIRSLISYKANVEIEDQKGWRPLHAVAQNGYADIFDLLLKQKVDIHAKYKPGATALHVAVRNEHEEIVKKLIDLGANTKQFVLDLNVLRIAALVGHESIALLLLARGALIDDKGSDFVTPLHAATWKGHHHLVEHFLHRGANVNAETIEKWTALHFAAKFGYYEIAQLLLVNGANLLATIDTGCTAFHIACGEGHVQVIQLLLLHGVDVNVRCASKRSCGLHWACANGRLKAAELLLLNNADVEAVTSEASTALHDLAAQRDYTSDSVLIAEALIRKGAPVDVKDLKGATPLHLACINGNLALAKELLANGANVNEETETKSALNLAVAKGHAKIVLLLLEHDAQVDRTTIYQRTCLHLAAEKYFKEIVQYLLEYKANINVTDGNLMTPLHWAVEKSCEEVVMLLLQAGADVNLRDSRFRLPLDIAFGNNSESIVLMLIKSTTTKNLYLLMACQKGMKQVAQHLIQDAEEEIIDYSEPLMESLLNGHSTIADMLLKKVTRVNFCTAKGLTPLHISVAQGFNEITQKLLTLEAAVDSVTCQNETALYYACLQGFEDIVDNLLSHGAKVDLATSENVTPLSVAAEKGSLGIVKTLIEHGAQVNVCNVQGFTPLHIAALFNHANCVKFLLDSGGADLRPVTNKVFSVLHLAALNGCVEIVNLVLDRVQVGDELLFDVNEDDETALDLALKNGHEEVARVLIDFIMTRNLL